MYITDYITGTVIQGLGNGRKFGFPTANVQPDKPVSLEKGAYAAWVRYEGKRHKGMLYVGTRPTLNLQELTYEIHVIDATPRLYGKQIAFKPVYKIAEEKRFRSRKELIYALKNYKFSAKKILSSNHSFHILARRYDVPEIMKIMEQAKRRMREQGIDQWQDGYPDEAAIWNDLKRHQGHVFRKFCLGSVYAAIVFDEDPYYEKIDGQWLSSGEPYMTVHRLAVQDIILGLDMARHVFKYAEKRARVTGVKWFRIDTHHDNIPMRNLIRNFGFTFCGIVQVRDGERLAYEKRVLQ
ncbi:MAG: riboflavin kinase [Bacteroidales bacterium]|nr:riboflavin kinase [Bacteroidales bacterium]